MTVGSWSGLRGSGLKLTVDSQGDALASAGVEVGVLGQTAVGAGVHAEDPGDGVLGSSVDLGGVVEPYVLTGRIGLSLTEQGNCLPFQCRETPLRYTVRSHFYIREIRRNCGEKGINAVDYVNRHTHTNNFPNFCVSVKLLVASIQALHTVHLTITSVTCNMLNTDIVIIHNIT